MKILNLNLMAFGPFTDTSINLEKGNQGMHIIYGPNEAGKSSALRAVGHMFYGFPERSSDDFIHRYNQLKIGAVLKKSNGQVLEIIRRKGRTNTLRAKDDKTIIDESKLADFLGGIDEGLFNTMFGIDHTSLVKGGQEIVSGSGNMGEILFAAGAGIANFRKIQSDLINETEYLFTPRGRNPRINAGISDFKQTQKEIRQVQLNAQEWITLDRFLKQALDEKQKLETILSQKVKEKNFLERIKNALPEIAQRKELQEKDKLLKDAILIPENFAQKRHKAMTDLQMAENEVSQAQKNFKEISQDIAKLHIPDLIIENAGIIELLYKKLGEYSKAVLDRPRIIGLQSDTKTEAKTILAEIRNDIDLDKAEKQLRLKKSEIIKIQELGSIYEQLKSRQENIKNQIIKLEQKQNNLKNQISRLPIPPDTGELQKTIKHVIKMGNIESHYNEELYAIQRAEAEIKTDSATISMWKGTLEEFVQIPVPLPETIDEFEDKFRQHKEHRNNLNQEIDKIEQQLLETETQIKQIQLEQEVPTEDDLNLARLNRDNIWNKIKNSELPFSNELALSYESKVKNTDILADRLRREADRVAQKAGLFAVQEKLHKQKTYLKNKLDKAFEIFETIKSQWMELWIDIEPKSPREMRSWVKKQTELTAKILNIQEKKNKAEILHKKLTSCFHKLDQCLTALQEPDSEDGETLAKIMERSQQFLQNTEKTRIRLAQLTSNLEDNDYELKQAQSQAETIDHQLNEWKTNWAKSIKILGLDADASPAQANAVLDYLKNLFFKLEKADGFGKRIKGIDRDTREYSNKVIEFASHAGPDLVQLPVEQIVTELNSRLTSARDAKTRHQSLIKQQTQEQQLLSKAKNKISQIHAKLDIMCKDAGCNTYDELVQIEEQSENKRNIHIRLEECEARLLKFSAGESLQAFIQEAEKQDPDTIDLKIAGLSEEIKKLDQEKTELARTIGSKENELSLMDGSAKAAELAEKSQFILAKIKNDAEQYIRLKLASSILTQAIERYREKNQGPILKRSTKLFSHMTLNAFQDIRLDFNDKNDPVMAGVRSGTKEIVYVDGMSEGTADQLYLAVRLATLEAWLDRHEPLPFIVDDILIKFDDQRAIATLQVFEKLSKKTQIIFFTHHNHLIKLAQQNLKTDNVFVHSLNGKV